MSVHHNVRELEAKCFLAAVLAGRGIGVVLGPTSAVRQIARVAPRSLLVDVTASRTRDAIFSELKSLGQATAAFDEEAIAYADERMHRSTRLSASALDNLDVFFAWGPKHAALVNSAAGRTVAVATGHPRLDLLRPMLRPHYEEGIRRILRQHGEHVLAISHGGSLFTEKFIERETNKLVRRQQLREDGDVEWYRNYLRHHRRLHLSFVDELTETAKQLPSVKFVYREKWNEHDNSAYNLKRKLFSQKNIVMDNRGTIPYRIMASQAIIHVNSAVAVEAYIAGVPPIAYRPTEEPGFDSHLPNAVSRQARTSNEISSHVLDILSAAGYAGAGYADVDKYVTFSRQIFAADLIADAIQKMLRHETALSHIDFATMHVAVEKAARLPNSLKAEVSQAVRPWSGKLFRTIMGRQHSLRGYFQLPGSDMAQAPNMAQAPKHVASFAQILNRSDITCIKLPLSQTYAVTSNFRN